MPNTPQNSFIPKNNLPHRKKSNRRQNYFAVTIVTFALFIGAPIASAAVFIYEKHTVNQITQTTRELDIQMKSFNEEDLLLVEGFDKRLRASNEILNSVFPVNNLLTYILGSTPKTVAFNTVDITVEQDMIVVSTEVVTDSFDAVLFYRDELLRNVVIATSSISELAYTAEVADTEEAEQESADELTINTGKIAYGLELVIPIATLPTLVNSTEILTELPSDTELLPVKVDTQ